MGQNQVSNASDKKNHLHLPLLNSSLNLKQVYKLVCWLATWLQPIFNHVKRSFQLDFNWMLVFEHSTLFALLYVSFDDHLFTLVQLILALLKTAINQSNMNVLWAIWKEKNNVWRNTIRTFISPNIPNKQILSPSSSVGTILMIERTLMALKTDLTIVFVSLLPFNSFAIHLWFIDLINAFWTL